MGTTTCDNDITRTQQDYRLDFISFEVWLGQISHSFQSISCVEATLWDFTHASGPFRLKTGGHHTSQHFAMIV